MARAAGRVIGELLADRVLERLRAAQGVIGLCKSYGRERLASACRRALAFDDARYRTIKTILRRASIRSLCRKKPSTASPTSTQAPAVSPAMSATC